MYNKKGRCIYMGYDDEVNYICPKCKNSFTINSGLVKRRLKKGKPNLCPQCQKEYLENMYKTEYSERTKKQLANRTEEEWKAINKKNSEGLKKHWENISDDERHRRLDPMKDGRKEWFDSKSDQQKTEFGKHLQASASDEVKEAHRKRTIEYNKSLSIEEKRIRAAYMNEVNRQKSTEERNEIYNRSHKWVHDLSPEDKEKFIESKRAWYENLSVEEKANFSKLIAEGYRNMPPEKREAAMRKRLTSATGKNKFHQKFEEYFIRFKLINYFYFIDEFPLSGNDITHCWDYAIFDQNGDISAVVDLDGEFYHADKCDYDGTHSTLEHDERRGLSVINDIPVCIINEINFDQSFKYLIKSLSGSYDQYVNILFEEFRSQPFPQPHYTDEDLMRSFEDLRKINCMDKYHINLSINSRNGDRLCLNFHQSIWEHKVGKMSPYDAWNNDEILKDHIRCHMIHHTLVNRNKVLQGFNVSNIAPRAPIFSAGKSKMIIHRYLNDFDTIFDPFSGYSGHMLGAISLGKRYIGQDPSEIRVIESNNMIDFLHKYTIEFDAYVKHRTLDNSSGDYPCLFTEVESDDQIDECLKRFKCKRYVFMTPITRKYINNKKEIITNKSPNEHKYTMIIIIDKNNGDL